MLFAGINFILSSMVFNVVPTFLEVSMVAGILAYRCGPSFAALTAATIAAYTAFTFAVTAVRIMAALVASLLGEYALFIMCSQAHTRCEQQGKLVPASMSIALFVSYPSKSDLCAVHAVADEVPCPDEQG